MVDPKGKVSRYSDPKKAYARIGEPQIEIASWCPDDKAEKRPEQVHFIVHWPVGVNLPPLVIRFKSPSTIGFFIEEMHRYRKHVWPNAELTYLEKDREKYRMDSVRLARALKLAWAVIKNGENGFDTYAALLNAGFNELADDMTDLRESFEILADITLQEHNVLHYGGKEAEK